MAKSNYKLPKVVQAWDDKHNHAWIPVDLGWGDKFWARVKREAIINAFREVISRYWIVLRIKDNEETPFKQFIERIAQSKAIKLEYLVVKTKATEYDLSRFQCVDDLRTMTVKEGSIEAWYFLHGIELSDIVNKADRYSADTPQKIHADILMKLLDILLQVEYHPEGTIKRFTASRELRHELALHRMKYLIVQAKEHKAPEYLGDASRDFKVTMARCIKADKPLIFGLKEDEVIDILHETEMLKEYQIDQIMELVRSKRFKRVLVSIGTPTDGAESDRKDGRYIVLRDEKMSAYSERVVQTDQGHLNWDTIDVPEYKKKSEEETD
jgi:hypothetical protein